MHRSPRGAFCFPFIVNPLSEETETSLSQRTKIVFREIIKS